MARFIPVDATALGWVYDNAARRDARRKAIIDSPDDPGALRDAGGKILMPRCPRCREALACSQWHPAAVSTLHCLQGCGTFRYHHRHGMLRRAPAKEPGASGPPRD